ncbi:hypothetical protein Tco_0440148 [Tanacetum coccineum]
MKDSTPWAQKYKSSQIFQTLKQDINMIFNGVECCKEVIHKKTWHGYIDPVISSTIETNFDPSVHKLMTNTERFFQSLKEEMVVDLKYFNSLENEIESLQSKLETQRTQFLNEIDQLSREYYYADHMNAILGVYTKLDEVTNLQYLKAQLQEKVIAISELKKLIDKMKGKNVDTNFGKPSILGKPPLQPIKNQPVIRQPTAFKYERSSFSKNIGLPLKLLTKMFSQNQSLHILGLKLPNTASERTPKPRNSYQQPRNWPPSMSSRVSNKVVNTTEPPRNSKPFLNSRNLACPTCKKCIYNANHDACILQYLSEVNSRASAQTKGAQSSKSTKRYILVDKKSDTKKHERRIFTGHRFSLNKPSSVYVKTTPPGSGLTWKPTGRIFTHVGLRWIPTGKTVGTCLNTNDNVIPLGKKTCTPNTIICANSSSNHKMIAGIEDRHHGPSDAMHNPS